jgi:L-Lysine epsilon oxidase N-terminal/L-lysine epsilon oxidase C-terminal domain
MPTYRIHPGIGIARLGNSETEFYLAPQTPAGLPLECDPQGNALVSPDGGPVYVTSFKDKDGRVKRQGARFEVFVYDDDHPEGRALKFGDHIEGGGNRGKLIDIQWRVYLANKKACWFTFDALKGEHGYLSGHPRRNADITGQERDRLIIDPGPRIVATKSKRRASFDRSGGEEGYATTFPPELKPFSIDTLGEMMTDDAGRLVVLGGHGCSGTEKFNDPGEPSIDDYANTDGWYDDTSDGPVMARLVMMSDQVNAPRYIDVEYPAWVVAAYPRFVPQILDIVTMDEVLHDLYLRQFAADTAIYGELGKFDQPVCIPFRDEGALEHWKGGRLAWNPNYRPWFFRDIWPILFRPDEFRFLCDILQQSNFPHDQDKRGTFDPSKLSQVPGRRTADPPRPIAAAVATAVAAALRDAAQSEAVVETRHAPVGSGRDESDRYGPMRRFLFDLLRRAGEENEFRYVDRAGSRVHNLPLMPLLCGDNPLDNTVPSKFLRLTDYQLFILRQWANGCFINEQAEGWLPADYTMFQPYPTVPPTTGRGLDRFALSNVLGGAFCPGGEIGWVMRNPSIYWEPYRIKAERDLSDFMQSAAQVNQTGTDTLADFTFNVEDPLSQDNDFRTGLQPGDLTKYMSLPWQSDFNECTTQPIDVTYADWNVIAPDKDHDERLERAQKSWVTLWWPAHRPLQSFEVPALDPKITPVWTTWSRGIPQTPAGDLKMVTAWWKLGFIIRNPNILDATTKPADQLTKPRNQNLAKYVSVRPSVPDS